jgi:hypothetical protein
MAQVTPLESKDSEWFRALEEGLIHLWFRFPFPLGRVCSWNGRLPNKEAIKYVRQCCLAFCNAMGLTRIRSTNLSINPINSLILYAGWSEADKLIKRTVFF